MYKSVSESSNTLGFFSSIKLYSSSALIFSSVPHKADSLNVRVIHIGEISFHQIIIEIITENNKILFINIYNNIVFIRSIDFRDYLRSYVY